MTTSTSMAMALEPEVVHGKLSKKPSAYPSLFSPDTDEEFSSDSFSDLDELDHPPLLKLKEVIQDTPKNLPAMLEILVPRLRPRREVKGVDMEDQQKLASIILGELSSQYSILAHQIDDPFLSSAENKEMHRGIAIDVCTIIEQLYGEYIYKAASLNTSVLSKTAGMSRLRARLLLEANKRINILASRRRVIDGLRGPIITQPPVKRYCKKARLPRVPRVEDMRRKPPPKRPDLDQFQLDQPLEFKMSRYWMKLESGLIRNRIRKLARKLPPVRPVDSSSDEEDGDEDDDGDAVTDQKEVEGGLMETRKHRLHRVSSLPELWGEFLLCDLEVSTRHKRPKSVESKEKILGIRRPPSIGNFMDLKLSEADTLEGPKTIELGQYTMDELHDDLCTLGQRSISMHSLGPDELHPLLQAHVHGLSSKQTIRLAEYEASMKKEEELPVERILTPKSSSTLDQNIPSVSTLDQLPYLAMHASAGLMSSTSSLHLISGLPTNKEFDGDDGDDEEEDNQSHTTTSFMSTIIPGFESNTSLGEGSFQTYTRQDTIDDIHSQTEMGDEILDDTPENINLPGVMAVPHSDMFPQSTQLVYLTEDGKDILLESTDTLKTPAVPHTTDTCRSTPPCSKPPDDLPKHPQGDVVTVEGSSGGVVRTSDIRVSERTPLSQLRLTAFGPVYNELEKDWDSSITNELDSNMYEGREITSVYEEIMKTLSNDHLSFEMEPTLEPSLEESVELSDILASGSLHHRRSQRVINHDLYRSLPHPWGKGSTREEWEESNEGTISQQPKDRAKEWKNTVDYEDFMKFASKDESDYLRLIYHLYDSDGSDSEAEEEAKVKREQLVAFHNKLREKEMRKQQQYRDKNRFRRGSWNVNCVMMSGGLGGEAMSSEDEDDGVPKTLNQKETLDAVQKRLQRIWVRLQVPKNLQIDMAIKYSGNITLTQLNKVLSLWDSVCDVIELREVALSRLESFEMTASDPTRFFAKGQRGSASVRLEEARMRDKLHNDLDRLDKEASVLIQKLQKEGDSVTYKGRLYSEKIRSDRLEMLYWLQQARRQIILNPEIKQLTLTEYKFYYNPKVM